MKLLLNRRIAIYGAGAVGCYFGQLFVKAGLNVEFIARGAQLKALKENGLIVDSFDKGVHNIKVNVVEKLEGLYDVIIVCVKSKDTLDVANIIKNHVGGAVVSFQNGVENPKILATVLGADKIISAAIYITASTPKLATVKHMSHGQVLFGKFENVSDELIDAFKAMLDLAGINNTFETDIKKAQWKKLLLNVAFNPLSALLRADYGKLTSNSELIQLIINMLNETIEAASIDGVQFEEAVIPKIISQAAANPNFRTSMLQDVEANKKPETDAILGPVVRILKANGRKSAYTETVLQLMNFQYGNYFHFSPNLAADILVANGEEVLLIERRNEPYGWAIPGGFVDLYEEVEHAAVRELYEETGIKTSVDKLKLLNIYSNPSRDKRGHTAGVVYVLEGKFDAKADDDAKDAKYFNVNNLPDMAFDHREIIMEYKAKWLK